VPEKATIRPGRNEPCRCGSGKKYKHCCLAKDEAADTKAREKREKAEKAAAAKAAKKAEKEGAPAEEPAAEPTQRRPRRHGTEQPWKRGTQNTRGFHKFTGPRKVGSG